ncbi:uncharacterized protein [Ptychodera flava]|uniref:uncharacterized protein isoform X2 n=1 Tax=Ptychodera flava TaxID=63121 RepID=UPI00396A5CF0
MRRTVILSSAPCCCHPWPHVMISRWNFCFATAPAARVAKMDTWSDDEVDKLVLEYRERQALWDVSMKQYKDKVLRETLMQEIAVSLDKPVTSVFKKIKNLRTVYARHRRGPKSGSSAMQLEKRQWILDKLSFCDKFIIPKSTRSTFDALQVHDSDAESEAENEEMLPENTSDTADVTPVPSKRRRSTKKDEGVMVLKDMVTACQKIADRTSQTSLADQSFGQYVAQELSLCNDTRAKAVARMKITETLMQMSCGGLSPPYGCPPGQSGYPQTDQSGIYSHPLTPGPQLNSYIYPQTPISQVLHECQQSDYENY